MKMLVTGSSGHLGEALVRTLRQRGQDVAGLDIIAGPCTTRVGTIIDATFLRESMKGVRTVFHAATLHKPHVATHSRQEFVDVNITGTLQVLEAAVEAGVDSVIYTSTTSVFGDALIPAAGKPAAWITEDVTPIPKNIYGVTKAAAEDLCELFHRNHNLPCIVLRTSRFFPEPDDNKRTRDLYDDTNAKVNEFLHRRVDIEDVVEAHLLAAQKARNSGFARYVISATTPFAQSDLLALRTNTPSVVRRHVPEYEAVFNERGWKMFPGIDRVYVNERARRELGWNPHFSFRSVIERLKSGNDFRSPMAQLIGAKGYLAETFAGGIYPVE